MGGSSQGVPCQRCGGYKVSARVSWATRGRSKLTLVLVVLMVTMVMAFRLHRCYSRPQDPRQRSGTTQYDRWMPLVFVGGVPRSGASLVRVLLDAHPSIRCGPDTRVIPRVLQMYHHWVTHGKEHARLREAGVHDKVLQSAMAALCLEVIVHHGDYAPRLCNKDPFTLLYAEYLSQLFPNAKFLFVVRDGRATVHSIISRQIYVAKYDLESYESSMSQWNNSTSQMFDQCLLIYVAKYDLESYESSMSQWNNSTSQMFDQCLLVGHRRCRVVHYELLVLRPRQVLAEILRFLDLPWDESVLHHQVLVGKPGGIRVSRFEQSSAEVRRPIYQDSLSRWVGKVPEDVLREMPQLAPMLSKLGYDPADNSPDYNLITPSL